MTNPITNPAQPNPSRRAARAYADTAERSRRQWLIALAAKISQAANARTEA